MKKLVSRCLKLGKKEWLNLQSKGFSNIQDLLEFSLKAPQRFMTFLGLVGISFPSLNMLGYLSELAGRRVNSKGTALLADPVFYQWLSKVFAEQWSGLLLAFVSGLWYHRYSSSAAREKELIVSCFSHVNFPTRLNAVIGGKTIVLTAFALYFGFAVLAASSGLLWLYLTICIFINVQDFVGNTLTIANVGQLLKDPVFVPDVSDPESKYCIERRKPIWNFYLERPHLPRIAVQQLALIIILVLALKTNFATWLLNLLTSMVLISNFIVVSSWRVERDEELERISASKTENQSAVFNGQN